MDSVVKIKINGKAVKGCKVVSYQYEDVATCETEILVFEHPDIRILVLYKVQDFSFLKTFIFHVNAPCNVCVKQLNYLPFHSRNAGPMLNGQFENCKLNMLKFKAGIKFNEEVIIMKMAPGAYTEGYTRMWDDVRNSLLEPLKENLIDEGPIALSL